VKHLKSPFGRARRRCEDNINVDVQEIRYEHLDWICATQYEDRRQALVNTVMKGGGGFLDLASLGAFCLDLLPVIVFSFRHLTLPELESTALYLVSYLRT
jgi:hypothetical protein